MVGVAGFVEFLWCKSDNKGVHECSSSGMFSIQ